MLSSQTRTKRASAGNSGIQATMAAHNRGALRSRLGIRLKGALEYGLKKASLIRIGIKGASCTSKHSREPNGGT